VKGRQHEFDMYPESEILFPARSIPEIRDARPGTAWHKLIDKLAKSPETSEDVLAFSLMMIKLGNCLTCDLDSYRASLGCTQCARRTVQGFKGNDEALVKKMEESRKDLKEHLKKRA
jgi:hypothetical protein